MRIYFTRRQLQRLYVLVGFLILVLVVWLIYFGNGQPTRASEKHEDGFTAKEIGKQVNVVAPDVEDESDPIKQYIKEKNLDNPDQQELRAGYTKIGFNKYASDRIPIDREIPDTRSRKCSIQPYYKEHYVELFAEQLKLGVVISLRNEPRSTLLRTVTSILKRTNEQILKEIILFDVWSDLDETIQALKEAEKMSTKVKVLRAQDKATDSINKGRSIAMYTASADVIFATDAHVEVVYGWAEPLLFFLMEHKEGIITPSLDVIDKYTFEYTGEHPMRASHVTGFDFFLDALPVPNDGRQDALLRRSYDIVQEPAVGPHFAMKRDFFRRVGGMSPNRKSGGAIELSFKAWMCGDGIHRSPCSHVGHIDRDPVLSQDADQLVKQEDVVKEKAKLAKFWMGDYAEYFCSRFKPHLCKDVEAHDEETIDRGACSSFDNYIQAAAFMIFIPKDLQAHGQLKNNAFGSEVCLNQILWALTGIPTLEKCVDPVIARHQYFMLTKDGQLRQDNGCLDINIYGTLAKDKCLSTRTWRLYRNKIMKHSTSNKCLTRASENGIALQECQKGEKAQMWTFKSPTE